MIIENNNNNPKNEKTTFFPFYFFVNFLTYLLYIPIINKYKIDTHYTTIVCIQCIILCMKYIVINDDRFYVLAKILFHTLHIAWVADMNISIMSRMDKYKDIKIQHVCKYVIS